MDARLLRSAVPRLLRLGERLGEQIVLEQHLGEAEVPLDARGLVLSKGPPGPQRELVLVGGEQRLAEAEDALFVAGREAADALPGRARTRALAPPRRELGHPDHRR